MDTHRDPRLLSLSAYIGLDASFYLQRKLVPMIFRYAQPHTQVDVYLTDG